MMLYIFNNTFLILIDVDYVFKFLKMNLFSKYRLLELFFFTDKLNLSI